jgi:hypothetical protein
MNKEKIKIFGEISTNTYIIFNENNEELKFINEIRISIRPKNKKILCDITFHHPAGLEISPKTYEVAEIILLDKGFKNE